MSQRTTSLRPWAALLVLVAICLLVGGVAGFIGLLSAGNFASGPRATGAAWVAWSVSGVAMAIPIASLPNLGFSVSRRVTIAVSVVVGLTVTLGGMSFASR